MRTQLATAYLGVRQPDAVLELVKTPTTAEEHYLRASAFYQAHRLPDADQESDAALTLAPENPKVLVLGFVCCSARETRRLPWKWRKRRLL